MQKRQIWIYEPHFWKLGADTISAPLLKSRIRRVGEPTIPFPPIPALPLLSLSSPRIGPLKSS